MKRSPRVEKMAAVHDAEILPVWSERFGRMILRDLRIPDGASVLNVGCATGYPAMDLLDRMREGRVIAIDPHAPLLEQARRKAGELAMKRIFFRTESGDGKLAFADEVYDLVVANLALGQADDPPAALREWARVTRLGGRVIATLPLRGTYAEFYDIYREVLVRHDKRETLERLDQHLAAQPDAGAAIAWAHDAGLSDVELEVEEFSLLFKSSREFFFAPVIEYGPLPIWKALAGRGEEMQQVFWHIKEAIDAYFSGRSFSLAVKAGCLRGVRPEDATRETVLEIDDADLTLIEDEEEVTDEDLEGEETAGGTGPAGPGEGGPFAPHDTDRDPDSDPRGT